MQESCLMSTGPMTTYSPDSLFHFDSVLCDELNANEQLNRNRNVQNLHRKSCRDSLSRFQLHLHKITSDAEDTQSTRRTPTRSVPPLRSNKNTGEKEGIFRLKKGTALESMAKTLIDLNKFFTLRRRLTETRLQIGFCARGRVVRTLQLLSAASRFLRRTANWP